jgi:hypothetical protein
MGAPTTAVRDGCPAGHVPGGETEDFPEGRGRGAILNPGAPRLLA